MFSNRKLIYYGVYELFNINFICNYILGGDKLTKHYEHTQIGYLFITVYSVVLFSIMYLVVTHGFNWIAFVAVFIVELSLANFAMLKTIIEDDVLEIRFGLGIICKKFSLKDIESCQIVKNPWYYGWGIRLTPYGWLYNVSGFYAVRINMKTGKKYLIGTDVPNELANVIEESI